MKNDPDLVAFRNLNNELNKKEHLLFLSTALLQESFCGVRTFCRLFIYPFMLVLITESILFMTDDSS